jgi:hypothetical protein
LTVTIKGADELISFLKQAPEQLAVKSGRVGATRASARLRTLIRRAAPRKTGKLRAEIKSKTSRRAAVAWVGLKGRFYYKTLEFGRKAHKRKGHPVAASPDMARFAFFKKAVDAHRATIFQMMIEQTRAALIKETVRLSARAGIRVRAR